MPTSASERLARLFVTTPLPAKPELDATEPLGTENEVNQSQTSQGQTSTSVDIEPSPSNPQKQDDQNLEDSDEDDEYVAMFRQKPTMKTVAQEETFKPRPEALSHQNDAHIESSKTIKYIPEGKKSLGAQEEEFLERNEQLQKVGSYDGNGRPMIGRFCHLNLVAKLPYKYMDDPDDRVSRHFFASNKFYERTWDLYYLHPPESLSKGPLLFVSSRQVQHLLEEISATFKISMEMPDFPFSLTFYDDGTPSPTFIGTSTSREDVNDFYARVPAPQPGHGECPSDASSSLTDSYETFHQKCEQAFTATKSKKTNAKHGKVKKHYLVIQESKNQIKRAERYFGLRPRTKPIVRSEGLTWNEEQANEKAQLRPSGLLIDFLDVNKPAQYPFDCDAVLISVDIEWYERIQGLVTEIGISTLDTLDLVDSAPGPSGENWIKHIRSRHIRIKGREHLVNRDFCVGNPNAFRFGQSEIVELAKIPEVIDSCFEWPFSVHYKKAEPGDLSGEVDKDSEAPPPPSVKHINTLQKGPKQRNLVLLGQDVNTDLEYLRKLGSGIFNTSNSSSSSKSNEPTNSPTSYSILETLDTALIYQSFAQETQPRSLSYICTKMDIDAWFTHNGGNDARYTLESLVKMVIKARVREDEEQRLRDPSSEGLLENELHADNMRRVDEKMDEARRKIRARS